MRQIGIIGSAGPEEYPKKSSPGKKIFKIAEELGILVAKNGNLLITGGKGGIMRSAAKGAKKKGGITVGIVKGNKRNTANKYIDVEIVANTVNTGEEALLVASCDGLIVIGGGAGTLQELACAYRNKKPVVAISSVNGISTIYANKYLDDRRTIKIIKAKTSEEAYSKLLKEINKNTRNRKV